MCRFLESRFGPALKIGPRAANRPAHCRLFDCVRRLNADGQVSIFNGSGGTVDVIADVLGWFPTGISSSGIPPARLMDSRVGQTTVDGQFGGGGPIRQATTYNLVIAGRGGVPTADLGAVALNVTVTNPTAGGFLTIYPQGAARPLASNVNFAVGQTIPNMVIVPVGGGGQISIFNSAGDSDVIVDVLGWFPNPTTPATTYGNDLVRNRTESARPCLVTPRRPRSACSRTSSAVLRMTALNRPCSPTPLRSGGWSASRTAPAWPSPDSAPRP